MPEAPRTLILALLGLLLSSGGAPGSPPRSRPTIEPTLPLLVDVRLSRVERTPARVRARLEVELRAQGALDSIALSAALPDGVRITGGAGLPGEFRMEDGERRLLVLPLEGPAGRDLPIRIAGTFRTEDGRSFRLGHGATLETPRPETAGRSYLGAWEVPAVPRQALRR
jgi:hypothetical protein